MFLQQAKIGENKWWQYLVTVIIVIVGYVVGQIPLSVIIFNKMQDGSIPPDVQAEFMETQDMSLLNMNENWLLFLILLSFVGALGGLWLMVTKLHDKPFRILITPNSSINWRKIFYGFGLWIGLTLVAEVIFYFVDPGNYDVQFTLVPFLILLVIALALIPLQITFEEIFLRGYLMQGFALLASNRWLPLVLTSLIFGLLHSFNPEVTKFGFGTMMSYYIGVGLFLGILTLMDDSLELALGVHAATNLYGALFFTFEGSVLQTPAIFRMLEVNIDYMLIVFFAAAVLFTIIVARKYGWQDWSKIYSRIQWQTSGAAHAEDPTPSDGVI